MSSGKMNTTDMVRLYVADRNEGFLIKCTEPSTVTSQYQAEPGDGIWLDGLTLRVLNYHDFERFSVRLDETGCIWYYDREITDCHDYEQFSVRPDETGAVWYYDRETIGTTVLRRAIVGPLRVACDTLKNFTNEMLRRSGA